MTIQKWLRIDENFEIVKELIKEVLAFEDSHMIQISNSNNATLIGFQYMHYESKKSFYTILINDDVIKNSKDLHKLNLKPFIISIMREQKLKLLNI